MTHGAAAVGPSALAGAMITGVLGAAWSVWASSGLAETAALSVRMAGIGIGIGVLIILACVRPFRSSPPAPEAASRPMFSSRAYRVTVVLAVGDSLVSMSLATPTGRTPQVENANQAVLSASTGTEIPMSTRHPRPAQASIARAVDSERIDLLPDNVHYLLADSSDTGGVLSSHRVQLAAGGNGAIPHRHDKSAEVFYVLDGSVDLLADHSIVIATAGDLVVVPPRLPHAFAATHDHTADLLILITPGVQRFGYFHQLQAISNGETGRASLLPVQQRYDTYFLDSPAWTARADNPGSTPAYGPPATGPA